MKIYAGRAFAVMLLVAGMSAGCEGGNEAQRRGVGAACTVDADCTEEGQRCVAFKGGYCGIAACAADSDCPVGSACVAHGDGQNYCFLLCVDKSDCNRHRAVDVEANCSANVVYVQPGDNAKACVPPSG